MRVTFVVVTNDELDALLDAMTLDEQVALLAGADNWHTCALAAHGIPAMRVSDGPAGARGTSYVGPASVNVPCGTALAASWDPELVQRIGSLLGREARAKGARVLLAPTVNLHRTPVGGRNFECQSEDPHLSARITVGYVRGVQHEGVAACVKHFVGNDTEFERMTIDNQIDERTLRELYLRPFEAAVIEGGASAVMTAYNRINGPFAADSRELITDVLRGEWGFDGIVMSDWFGLHSTVEALEAGLDLEMPGPARLRGKLLLAAIHDGRVEASLVRTSARRLVRFMDTIGAVADGGPGPEGTRDELVDRTLVREAGSAGMVLLRNEHSALPLAAGSLRSVAVIGPNAAKGRIMGGGSAMVNAIHEVHPLGALTERFAAQGVDVLYSVGCKIHRTLPQPDPAWIAHPRISFYASDADLAADAEPVLTQPLASFRNLWPEAPVDGVTREAFAACITAAFTPDATGAWSFGLTSAGSSVLRIDGVVVVDDADAPLGGSFFGIGKNQVTASIQLDANRTYALRVDHRNSGEGLFRGITVGIDAPELSDPVDDAVSLAATTDTAVIVVGTNDDWESEGYDRSTIDLPGRQDELIREVAKVSPRTIVVVNAGSPVSMPWVDVVDAVLFVWFPGQEFGDALGDVLFGDVEPGGRLPVTLPRRFEDSPAFEHHPGRNGVARYLERRLVGYRWFDTTGREPLFAFGHGLSYADLTIDSAAFDGSHSVEVDVRNSSSRPGAEVVQVYVSDLEGTGAPDDPSQQLVGFAKVVVPANSSITATVGLDPRWAAHWDTASHAWAVRPGERMLRVGRSSRNIVHNIGPITVRPIPEQVMESQG